MASALPVLVTSFLVLSGLVTAADPIPVYGELGADLHLPVEEACKHQGSYRFDILRDNEWIGTYHDELQGLNNYVDRLAYDKSTCTATLRGLRTQDGTTFTVRLFLNINDRSTPHDVTFQVTIRVPPTSHPSTPATKVTPDAPNGTQASNDGVQGFVSFCLSLDSVVNAAFGLLLLRLQGCCNKMNEGRLKVVNQINSIITVVSEICSICTMLIGNHYTLFLSLIPVILIVDVLGSRGYLDCLKHFLTSFFSNIFPCCACCSDDSSSKNKSITSDLWIGFMLLIQVLFAVGISYFGIDNLSIHGTRIIFLFLSLFISAVLRAGIIIIIIFCFKRFDQVPTEDPTTSDGPKNETSF